MGVVASVEEVVVAVLSAKSATLKHEMRYGRKIHSDKRELSAKEKEKEG
jgi:hypothetical protein